MEEKEAQALFKKYASGNCTEEEKAWLESWYLQHSPAVYPDLSAEDLLADKQAVLAALDRAHQPLKNNIFWRKTAVAAATLALISFGLYSYLIKNKPAQVTVQKKTDILPGSNKAVLTLASGERILLSSDKKGLIVKAGELVYHDGTEIKTTRPDAATSAYNTISTPAGGQYQIILQDGTKVWLNAASSLNYPTHFSGTERKVGITGEAYFEVAHNKDKPFKVISKGQSVEVLGTHFNIMAYDNERAVKTTLLEGSVKVNSGTAFKYLVPGQQAVQMARQIAVKSRVDLEDVISWKNGYFKFDEDIRSIMNKIARWYDIDVIYKPGVDLNQTFSGEVSRTKNVSVLLSVMELTGNVNFKVEGRRIIVMP